MTNRENDPTEIFDARGRTTPQSDSSGTPRSSSAGDAYNSRPGDYVEPSDYQTRVDLPTSQAGSTQNPQGYGEQQTSGWNSTYGWQEPYDSNYEQSSNYGHADQYGQGYNTNQGFAGNYAQGQPAPTAASYPAQGGQQSNYQQPVAGQSKNSGPSGGEIARFVISLIIVSAVAALTTWVIGRIIDLVMLRISEATDLVYTPFDLTYYAVLSAIVAALAGLLWVVLNVATSMPSLFYSWIVGLALIAAVVFPLLTHSPFYGGILQSVMNLVVGLPIAFLVAPISRASFKESSLK